MVVGILEIHFLEDARGQHFGIDLEPHLERGGRIDLLLHHFVQPELVGPELLVTKGVETENFFALADEGGIVRRSGGQARQTKGGAHQKVSQYTLGVVHVVS